MVDESLKRLLDAEAKAELVIAQADAELQAIIEQARHDVRDAEKQHAERVSGIHASFLAQAEQRAQQTIAELKRRTPNALRRCKMSRNNTGSRRLMQPSHY